MLHFLLTLRSQLHIANIVWAIIDVGRVESYHLSYFSGCNHLRDGVSLIAKIIQRYEIHIIHMQALIEIEFNLDF